MARRAVEGEDRWTLAGPTGKEPWTAGTLDDVKASAAFIDEWSKRTT